MSAPTAEQRARWRRLAERELDAGNVMAAIVLDLLDALDGPPEVISLLGSLQPTPTPVGGGAVSLVGLSPTVSMSMPVGIFETPAESPPAESPPAEVPDPTVDGSNPDFDPGPGGDIEDMSAWPVLDRPMFHDSPIPPE